jgi:hypothetical protein
LLIQLCNDPACSCASLACMRTECDGIAGGCWVAALQVHIVGVDIKQTFASEPAAQRLSNLLDSSACRQYCRIARHCVAACAAQQLHSSQVELVWGDVMPCAHLSPKQPDLTDEQFNLADT